MARASLKELAGRIRLGALARPVLLVLGVGTFLAIIGPFGSHEAGWPRIWIYWVGLIGLGAAFGYLPGFVLPRIAPRLPEWTIYVFSAVFVSVPVSIAVAWLNGGPGGGVTVLTLALNYPPVLVISGFVTAVVYAVAKLTAKPRAAAGPARPSRALIDKLPHRLRAAPVLSLTSEDHYLRVRTQAGEALILMRLTDAIAAMEGVDGARTHRSWWVAKDAVADARKGDGRGVLVLADGAEAPVSRTYYPALREAGWF